MHRATRATPLALLTLALFLLLAGESVRTLEASVQSMLLTLMGVRSHALGQAVIFPLDGRWVGVGFSLGCSVAPLTALFLCGSAAAAWMRPLRLRSVAAAVGALLLLFMVANQLRIAAIVAMMRTLGFERGYEMSHIFLGSVISTVGFVAATFLFIRFILRDPALKEIAPA